MPTLPPLPPGLRQAVAAARDSSPPTPTRVERLVPMGTGPQAAGVRPPAPRPTAPLAVKTETPPDEGRLLASPELRAVRRAICEKCPHLVRAPFQRCGKCGCPIKSKTTMKRATCPLGKW